MLRVTGVGLGALLGAPLLDACASTRPASSRAFGRTTSRPLKPFDPQMPGGPPTQLPRRIAWANTAETEIFAALGQGMAAAARQRGLEYLTANADGDPETNVDQINGFLARGIGAITVQPLDVSAQAPAMAAAISRGACVCGIITNPSTVQVAASQYAIGYQQGRSAAAYITAKLGGRATVFNANQDEIPQLAVRNRGVLAGLRTAGPGVTIIDQNVSVADQSAVGAFSEIQAVLERHPDVMVFLGDDTPVLGFYRGVEAAGVMKEQMYFGGVDGDTNSLALIRAGTPYRSSVAFAWPLMGYGMGRFFADWIDGRQVPRVMVAHTTLLDSAAAVTAFEADNADLEGTFADRTRYEQYFPLLGNVSYQTRQEVWHADYQPLGPT